MRSLGRGGVAVYAIDRDDRSVGFSSKYCRGKFIWDLAKTSVDDSVSFLANVAAKIRRRPVLIANSDDQAMFVADYAGRLAECFIFPQPSADLVRSLCSKKEMYHLAKKAGVDTPETAFPRSRDDVLEYIKLAQFPVLLKPIFTHINGRLAKPIVIAHAAQELLKIYDATEDPSRPNLMLQEFIPGGDDMTWTFNGYFDKDSECRIAFTGRKLRNFPPRFGMASLAVCQGNDEVEQITVRFMKAVGYQGGLDLGYRYDPRDGRYKVNDINPRIGAMLRLFVGNNGMDVARALYLDMTGQKIAAATAPDGRKWIVEDHDLRSSLYYYRSGELSLHEWIRSLRGVQESAYFARDDLRPFGAMLMRNAKGALRAAVNSPQLSAGRHTGAGATASENT